MRVLVLDDDVHMHRFYRSILRNVPDMRDIVCAQNEHEFSQFVNIKKPDVIIADIHMEPLDGPSILRKYKSEIVGSNVFIMSCADSLAEETRVLREEDEINVVEHISKPLNPIDLYEIFGHDPD